jgi:G3E family GTPase
VNAAVAVRPLTVVSGALGSGKTTMLRSLLADPRLRDTAVLVNEFGDVGLDHHQLRQVDENTVLLPSGCVCCATRTDIEQALQELLTAEAAGRVEPVRRVVLETTGLADPAPVVATMLASPVLRHHFAVDRVVVTVDAQATTRHVDQGPEWTQQVVCADVLAVTKTDLVPADVTAALMRRLRRLNPAASVVPAPTVDVTADPGPASRAASVAGLATSAHLAGVASSCLTFTGRVDWAAFAVWLSALLRAHGDRVLRVKALLDTGAEGPVVVDGVQHVVHPPRHLDRWDGERRSSVVLITRDLPPDEVLCALQHFVRRDDDAPLPR